mgnify:CR=1 FL=1
MYKKIVWFLVKAILLIVVLAFIVSFWDVVWKWILVLMGSIGVSLGIKGKVENIPVKPTKEEQDELDERVKAWKEKLDKFRNGGLMIILFLFFFALPSSAFDLEPPKRITILGKTYIEESYYLALESRFLTACELLNEAEEIVDREQSLNKKKDEIIEEKRENPKR